MSKICASFIFILPGGWKWWKMRLKSNWGTRGRIEGGCSNEGKQIKYIGWSVESFQKLCDGHITEIIKILWYHHKNDCNQA